MSFTFTEGIERAPVRCLIYGVEGIGKSTYATKLPGASIIDVEDGTRQIECRRTRPADYDAFKEIMRNPGRLPPGTKTVVIDTADWLERMVTVWLCKRHGVRSIENVAKGYGKGYTMLAEEFHGILSMADTLIEKGLNVVFVAHSTVKRVSPPDQSDGYDRYEMKLTKQVGPLLREWAEMVLFCNYQTSLIEGEDGRTKAIGGTERIIYTTRTAAYDAKNRYGLPAEIPMDVSAVVHLFTDVPAQPGRRDANVVMDQIEGPAVPNDPTAPGDDKPAAEPITPAMLKGITEALVIPEAKALIDTGLEFEGAATIADLTKDSAARIIADIKPHVLAHRAKAKAATTPAATSTPTANPAPADTKATPTGSDVKTPFPAAIVAKIEPHSEKVTAYMRGRNMITAEQTWRDAAPDVAEKLILKTDAVLRAAGVIKTP